eukprot:IDg10123t1
MRAFALECREQPPLIASSFVGMYCARRAPNYHARLRRSSGCAHAQTVHPSVSGCAAVTSIDTLVPLFIIIAQSNMPPRATTDAHTTRQNVPIPAVSGAQPRAPRIWRLAAATLDTARTSRGWRLALAGGIAGMLSNTVLHPLDTVKTVRQADPRAFRGVLWTAREITRTRGAAALYAGIGPALLGSALSSSLYFGAYELAKRRLSRASVLSSARASRRVPTHAVAAVCGNVASSVLFVPKEVVKQRMQAGVDTGRFFDAARALVRSAGVPGLYRGYKATLLRNIPSTVLRFVVFEECRRIIVARRPSAPGEHARPLALAEFLAAGALAGAFASACTTPLDVVKTRLSTGRLAPGTGVLPALRSILREHGVPGLFVGIRPRIIRAALGTGIGFGSYELCKSLLRAETVARPLAVVSRHIAHVKSMSKKKKKLDTA